MLDDPLKDAVRLDDDPLKGAVRLDGDPLSGAERLDEKPAYQAPRRGWFAEPRPKTQTTVSPLPEGYGKGSSIDMVADAKDAASGAVAEVKAAAEAYRDMTPSERLKFHLLQPVKIQKALMEAGANVPITAASTLASIPNALLSPEKAKAYTEWVQQNTGLMTGDPFAQADEEITNPAERLAAKVTRAAANAAPYVLAGEAMPGQLGNIMGAEGAGSFLAESGAKGTPVGKRTLGALTAGLLGRAQGSIPLGRTAEAVLTKGGTLSPAMNHLLADAAAAGDMSLFQALQNANYRSTGVDPNRDITEGLGTAALMGAGFREAMGGFGRAMTNVPEPETYRLVNEPPSVDATATGKLVATIPLSRRAGKYAYVYEQPDNTRVVKISTAPPEPPTPSPVARPELVDKYEFARQNIQGDEIGRIQGEYDAANESVRWKVNQLESELAKKGWLSKPKMKRLTELRNSLTEQRLGVVNREQAAQEEAVRRLNDTDISDWLGYTPKMGSNAPDMIASEIGRTPNYLATFGDQRLGTAPHPASMPSQRKPLVEGPPIFQENVLPRVAPEASNLDQAFYQKQMAPLADLMAMYNAMKGPWSKLPDQAKANAGRWFDVNHALADHPDSPALQAELASIPLDTPTKQGIEILKWAKQEQANAVNRAAAILGEEPPENREYYLPRRVQMEAGEAPVQTASTTPNAMKARTYMAIIDEQGNRRIVNTDAESPGPNERLGQATRAEIEAATGKIYGKDDLAELMNSTAQSRAAERAASLGQDIKRQFGTQPSEAGKVPEGYAQFPPDHPAHSLVGDTPIRQDAAKVVDFYTNRARGDGVMDSIADLSENIKHDVMNIGFLNPLIHPPNQFTHYFKGAGVMRMLDPRTMGGDLADATVRIANFDPEYQQFLLSGGAAMRRQAHLEETKTQLNQALEDPRLQKVLEDLKARGEEGFLPKALREVVNGPVWLLDDAMRFDLWRKKVAKGMSPEEATVAVDKDFPSYRNPALLTDETKPTGETSGAKKLTNAAYNTVFNMERGGPIGRALAPTFMKFRYGAWASSINTIRKALAPEGFNAKEQLTNPDAWKQRLEGADKIAAVALLGAMIYPALDAAYDAALSEPEKGLKYKARRAGPLHQYEQIKDVLQGDKTFPQFAQEFAMPNPAVKGLLSAAGYDPYFNRPLPEGTRLQTAASAISPVQDLVQTFGEGKPGAMAIAKQLMGKRDRTELEQFVSRISAQGMGQMKEETVDAYRAKNKLFKAWDNKDDAAAQAMETEIGDERRVAKWRKEYETPPHELMAEKMRRFAPEDLQEAARRAEGGAEKTAVANAIAHKLASKTIKPAERLTLKAILAKLQREGATLNAVPVDTVEVENK